MSSTSFRICSVNVSRDCVRDGYRRRGGFYGCDDETVDCDGLRSEDAGLNENFYGR